MNVSAHSSSAWLLTAEAMAADTATNRPPNWARPIPPHAVSDRHQVSATLFSSAQISAEGMKRIEATDVSGIVSVR